MATPAERDRYLRKTYRVSLEEWEAILARQGGGCYGCLRPGVTRSLHTDHDHKSNLVRGILCASCNSALRKMKDDPQIAARLSLYLSDPPAFDVVGERQCNVPKRRRRARAVQRRKRIRNP